MYNSYLHKGDEIKKLDYVQLFDLCDYIKMRNQNLPCTVKWETIRSMVITERGMTLWQLSEKYLDDQETRAIGQLESPVNLFEWILKKAS